VGQASGELGLAYFQVSPKLTIEPRSVPAGGTVTVEGFGFGELEGVTLLCCGSAALGSAHTNHLGQFSVSGGNAATIKIPAGTAPGTHAVSGTGQTSGATAKCYVTVE